MNNEMNEKIVEDYNGFDGERLPFMIASHEKRAGELKTIIESMNGLLRNEYYRNLIRLEWKPRFERMQNDLRKERDPIQMYRIQGKLEELADLIDFTLIKTLYDNEFTHIKGLIEQEKNATKNR